MTRWHRGFPLLLAACFMLFSPAASVSAEAENEPVLYFVSVSINGVVRHGLYTALETDDDFLLETSEFETLGMIKPGGPPTVYRKKLFLSLSGLAGLTYEFILSRLHVEIICPPGCFPGGGVSGAWQYREPDPTPLGMLLNYDVLAEKNDTNTFIGAIGDFGIFSNYGFGNVAFSARDLTHSADLIRLEASWTINYPSRRTRFRVGDSVTEPGGWGQPVRFAGVQFGTDFSLQPGFITFPTPTIGGEAALPSTAEIYVNDVRRSSVDVEPGPFTIEQPPVITGSGDLRVVVRDLLGRETVITQPFYASRNLLRAGLKEYSLEAGALRKNYGVRSNDYNEPFASGTFRTGLSDRFTAGLHAEVSTKRAGIGPYIDWQTPFGGVLSAAAVASVKDGKSGGLLQLDYSWTSQKFGFHLSNEITTVDFSRLGSFTEDPEPRMKNSANFGFSLTSAGALSLNYTRLDERVGEDFQVASFNYSTHIGDLGVLGLNVSRTFGNRSGTAIFLSFTAHLAERTTASATMDRSGGRWKGTMQASRNPPYDGGFGYRAEASKDDNLRGRARVTYGSARGDASLDISHQKNKSAARLGLRGGMVFMSGDLYLTKPVNDSFALVKVGDFEGVSVLREHRRVAKTDQFGRALITGLRAYEENTIAFDPLDLPLSANIAGVSMKQVPRRRSGVIVEFPVSQAVAAIITVVDDTGKPLPPGILLRAPDRKTEIPVGFGGEVYVTGLEKPLQLHAQTAGGACTLRLPAIKPAPQPARLGTYICKGDNP